MTKEILREGESAENESQSQHSPLPWRADGDAQYVWATDAAGEFPVLQIRGWGHLTGTGGLRLRHDEAIAIQEANAQFIVRACNAHDVLLAIVRAERDRLNAYMVALGSANCPGFLDAHALYSTMCAAIAKAEGRG